jgi:1-acyl-sn-glycerol-3-phosphate acyltransferase
MLNALVMLAIIEIFICYDMLLGLTRLLDPGRAFEAIEGLARRASWQIFALMRGYRQVRLDYENLSGRELPERFLLVTNHQSLLDIPLCILLFPGHRLRFVAKRELGTGLPFVSLLLRMQGHALVRRSGDATQAMRSLLRFARRCEREGSCPVVFPEGTRSRDGEMGAFHTAGVRKVLAETPLPMVVAVLDGGWRIARAESVIRNLKGARIRVRVLAVTPTIGAKREVLESLETARATIAEGLAELRAESD